MNNENNPTKKSDVYKRNHYTSVMKIIFYVIKENK